MNLSDLEEMVYRYKGFHASGQRLDSTRQQIRDDINLTVEEIRRFQPWWWFDVYQTSFDLESGTSVYTLDDWMERPLRFWTADSSAHGITQVPPSEKDFDGSRADNLSWASTGPYDITPYPNTTAPSKSGTGGVSDTSTTFTAASGDAFASTDVGSRIRLDGSDMDYSVQAYTSSTVITLGRSDDTSQTRAFRARLTGVGTSNSGSALSGDKWEITPPGTLRVEIVPAPSEVKTIYYAGVRRSPKLLNDDDVPALPEQFHEVIASGVMKRMAGFNKDWESYGVFKSQWNEGVARIRKESYPYPNQQDRIFYSHTFAKRSARNAWSPGTFWRR